mmetsp:Transcript_18451/g.48689  ORF Transcript_18451/g.48689 Transcript_18451/m.48689 type:complete len:193 (+) Transcript_18451:1460-2038(+)
MNYMLEHNDQHHNHDYDSGDYMYDVREALVEEFEFDGGEETDEIDADWEPFFESEELTCAPLTHVDEMSGGLGLCLTSCQSTCNCGSKSGKVLSGPSFDIYDTCSSFGVEQCSNTSIRVLHHQAAWQFYCCMLLAVLSLVQVLYALRLEYRRCEKDKSKRTPDANGDGNAANDSDCYYEMAQLELEEEIQAA